MKLYRNVRGGTIFLFDPPQHCQCGGILAVKDFRKEAPQDGRYEAYCQKCLTCDPNGWSSKKAVIENSPQYFK